MGNWTLDTIDWDRFDGSKVDPEILRNIKAAAMVERNGGDYGDLSRPRVRRRSGLRRGRAALGREEIQHGMALGRWAQLADPGMGLRRRLRALQRGLPAAARRHHIGARQPGRRDDGALHRRDRYQLLLQRAQGRDRRSRCSSRSAPRSRPTSSATTSCSTRTCGAA